MPAAARDPGAGAARAPRPLRFLPPLLLLLPLAAVLAWLYRGGVSRSFGPGEAGAPSAASAAPFSWPAGLPPPEGDYPADRLYERVDGAADALRAAGCNRILVWRVSDPPAEMEILVFEGDAGAARVLARDAGPERQPGPGDEASVGDQAVLFRRGRYYGRVLGDPQAAPAPARLLDLARKLDASIREISRPD